MKRTCGMLLACALGAVQLLGCYQVKKWDIAEGQQAIYKEDPSKQKMKSTRPVRGAITVNLMASKHMACILKPIDENSDAAEDLKACYMTPIVNADIRTWHTLFDDEKSANAKTGYIAENLGEVLASELKASLEQYYVSAEVNLVHMQSDAQEAVSIEADVLVSPDSPRLIAERHRAEIAVDRRSPPPLEHTPGIHIPFYIDAVPVYLFVPTDTDERLTARALANAVRVSTDDLAKKLIEHKDEAARSARSASKNRSITVVF